jgi:hypothetical protein
MTAFDRANCITTIPFVKKKQIKTSKRRRLTAAPCLKLFNEKPPEKKGPNQEAIRVASLYSPCCLDVSRDILINLVRREKGPQNFLHGD